jgi:hypothetical protein
MSTTRRIYDRFLSPHNPESLVGRGRAKRWAVLTDHFPDLANMTVLDLGGIPQIWELAPVQPKQVICINLSGFPAIANSSISAIEGDVFNLPHRIAETRFDLVYCSSLIEHVGGRAMRERLANVITTQGDHHWVQAPYQYFPIEPHWVFPLFQFLPLRAKLAVGRHWAAGGYSLRGLDKRDGIEKVMEVELPTLTEFRYLFSSSEIIIERMAGLPKSLIATL